MLLESHLTARHAALGLVGLLSVRGRSEIAGVSACGRYIQVWDRWGDELSSWLAHSDAIDALVLNNDDPLTIISAGRNGKIKIWDLSEPSRPRRLRTLRHHWLPSIEKSILTDLFMRRQQLTIGGAATMVGEYQLWKSQGSYAEAVESEKTTPAYLRETFIALHRKHFGGVIRLAVSRDGQIGVSSAYETAKVWNLTTGYMARTIKCADDFVSALAVAPNGSRMLAAAGNAIGVFDVTTGRKTMALLGHTGSIFGVEVMPNNCEALSVSQDCTLKVWDLASGRLQATYTADAPLYCCQVAPDNANIVAGDEMGAVHFLRVER